MKKMNNKGFSLIELIIVIAIMAVLVAVIAPNLTGYLSKSKKNTDVSNADTMANIITNALQDFTTDSNMTYNEEVTDDTVVVAADEAKAADEVLAKDGEGGTVIEMDTFISDCKAAGKGSVLNNIYVALKKYVTETDSAAKIAPKVTGNKFVILFEGTYDDGYTCKVQSFKSSDTVSADNFK